MAMGSGGGFGAAVSEINVTPLIDVLLVLLILFMVIVPVTPLGLDGLVPQPPKDPESVSQPSTIVVQILRDPAGLPSYKINEDSFSRPGVEARLREIFSTRVEKVMFVKGDPDLQYGNIAEVIDLGHLAGVTNIGMITPKIEAGQ